MDQDTLKKPVDVQGLSLALAKTKADYDRKYNSLSNKIIRSDWNQENADLMSYVDNRPAIRAGDGENSVMIGQIEQSTSAGIYTIYITGDAKATTYSYTTSDTLPSTSTATNYLAFNGVSLYKKVTAITSDTITFSDTYNTTNTLDNYEIKLYYNYKIALGKYSVTEGRWTAAIGTNAHAEGSGSRAISNSAHAEGMNTYAEGMSSHSEGSGSIALGLVSHAEGMLTIASSRNQHVQGRYNIEDTANAYADIVGNGTSSARSNAYTLDWSGNGWYAGKLTVGTGPTENMDVATKQYVDAATAGVSPNLSGLSDTNISSPANGQVLKYDSASSKWVNSDISGVLYVTITGNQTDGFATTANFDDVYTAYQNGYDIKAINGTEVYNLSFINSAGMGFTKNNATTLKSLSWVKSNNKVSYTGWNTSNIKISTLTDTTISSPATGQILIYDGTTSKWINTTSPYMTEAQVNSLITAALAQYGDGDTASYGFDDASEVSY